MSLQDFINKYNDKYIGDHECGTLVRQYAIEVQGITPVSYPSARDYWYSNVGGYTRESSPQPGDWVIYERHGLQPDGSYLYPDGHMAVYVDGQVFEQNADPGGSPAHLFNRANTYLLGYLRLEGEDMPNDGDITNYLKTEHGDSNYQPSQAEVEANRSVSFKDWISRLAYLNEGDAVNMLNAQKLPVTDASKAQMLSQGYKYWMYNFSGKINTDYVPVTDQLYKKG